MSRDVDLIGDLAAALDLGDMKNARVLAEKLGNRCDRDGVLCRYPVLVDLFVAVEGLADRHAALTDPPTPAEGDVECIVCHGRMWSGESIVEGSPVCAEHTHGLRSRVAELARDLAEEREAHRRTCGALQRARDDADAWRARSVSARSDLATLAASNVRRLLKVV